MGSMKFVPIYLSLILALTPLHGHAEEAAAPAPELKQESATPVKRPLPSPVVPLQTKLKTIREIKVQPDHIEILADFAMYNYSSFTIPTPGRLVLDIPMGRSSIKTKVVPINRFGIKQARIGIYPDKLRLVFDADGSKFPNHYLQKSEGGLMVIIKPSTGIDVK